MRATRLSWLTKEDASNGIGGNANKPDKRSSEGRSAKFGQDRNRAEDRLGWTGWLLEAPPIRDCPNACACVPVLCCAGWYVQYREIHVPRYEGLRQLGFYTCFLGGKSWGYLALRFAMLEGSSIKTPDSCNCNCVHTCSMNWPSTVQCSAVGVPSETRDISVSSGSSHLSSLPAHYTLSPLDFLLVSRAHAQSHVCLLAQGPGSVLLLPVSCNQPNSCYPYYSEYTAINYPKEIKNFSPIPPNLSVVCIPYYFLLRPFHLPLVGSGPRGAKAR